LYNVDQDTLRSKCVHVSNEWKQMIQSLSFWKRYHRYWTNKTTTNSNQRNKIPDELFCGSYDWVFFSHINPNDNPFERNLLRNGNGSMVSAEELKSQHHRYFEDGFTKPWPTYPFWEVFSSGGKGWTIENPIQIKNQCQDNIELLKLSPKGCFIASYHSCTKSQTVDLIEECGISREILHNPKYQFDINVSEWHIMNGPCRYELHISLRNEENMIIQELVCDSKFSSEFEKGIWGKVHRTITVCGIRRLRFITFYHGATCNEPVPTHDLNNQVAIDSWADVGTKMAEGSISFTYPVITQMTKDEQLYSNRYIVHSKFKGGKTWSTIDSFGPLGIHKFSLGSTPIKAFL